MAANILAGLYPISHMNSFFIFLLQALMLSVVLFSFIASSRIFGKYVLFSLKNVQEDAEPVSYLWSRISR